MTSENIPAPAPSAAPPDVAAEIIRHVWSRRRFIAKVMAVAIPVFVVLLLLIPRRYRAEATIILLPPRFTSEVRTEPLSVATAKTLLESGEMVGLIIDRVREAHKALSPLAAKLGGAKKAAEALRGANEAKIAQLVPGTPEPVVKYLATRQPAEIAAILDLGESDLADWTVEELSRKLTTEDIVEKKTASDIKIAPLIRLLVVADNGPKAQLLANTWANLFETKYDDITNSKTRRQYESIRRQQAQSQTELVDIQTTVVQFKATNNLELYQRKIDEFSQNLSRFIGERIAKEASLRTEEKKLGEMIRMTRAVADQQGFWLGKVHVTLQPGTTPESALAEALGDVEGTTVTQTPTLVDADAEIPDPYVALRNKTLQSRNMLVRNMAEMDRFYLNYPVELLEKERDQVQTDYLAAASKLRTGAVKRDALERTLRTMDAELSATQRFLTLAKQVPDVTIADAIGQGRRQELRGLAQVQFQQEQLNPSFEQILQQRNEISKDLEVVRNELDLLSVSLPGKEAELKNLQRRVYIARMLENPVKEGVQRWGKVNQRLSDDYVETNASIYTTNRQILILRQELAQLDKETSQAEAEVRRYQELYDSSAARLQNLESRQRAIQRNADLLLQKLQEAQVAKDQELSDVSIAAAAVTPMKHFFPMRTLFLTALTLLTFAVLAGMIAREKYMELRAA